MQRYLKISGVIPINSFSEKVTQLAKCKEEDIAEEGGQGSEIWDCEVVQLRSGRKMAAPPVAPPRKGRQTAIKTPDLIVEDHNLEANGENFRSQENGGEKASGDLDQNNLHSDGGELDRNESNADRGKAETTEEENKESDDASFTVGTAKGVPNALGRELKELLRVSKEKDSMERTNALLESVRRINEYLEAGDHTETIEEDSQAGVIPIQIGKLNFQIEADKLEGIFVRAQNNEGSVEELLADYFVRNVAEIIEGSKEKDTTENDHQTNLEMAFKEKLRAKIKAEEITPDQAKGVSFAAAPGQANAPRGRNEVRGGIDGRRNNSKSAGPGDRQKGKQTWEPPQRRPPYQQQQAANRAEGENVVWRRGAMPQGFQRLMDLEEILLDVQDEQAMEYTERATDFRSDFELFPEIASNLGEREDEQRMAEGPFGPGLSSGPGLDEASLAQMADEIILEAAMGHIERIAEVVMHEENAGPDQSESPSPSISFSVWAKGMKEKLGPEKGKVIDEAKNEVVDFFVKAYQLKYEEMEPQLLEKAAVMFDNKISEAERSPITPSSGRIDGFEGKGSSSKIEMPRKKAFDVEEWAIELNKIWEEDEEMWSVMDDMFEELKKILETHGGINKYDIVGAREAAKILRMKIESSSLKEKYGPTSSLGRGLKNQISTGYMLCKWAGDYYDNSDGEEN
nr:hypothetical protein Iba_chr11dCG13640 [Ipomoea batatas]